MKFELIIILQRDATEMIWGIKLGGWMTGSSVCVRVCWGGGGGIIDKLIDNVPLLLPRAWTSWSYPGACPVTSRILQLFSAHAENTTLWQTGNKIGSVRPHVRLQNTREETVACARAAWRFENINTNRRAQHDARTVQVWSCTHTQVWQEVVGKENMPPPPHPRVEHICENISHCQRVASPLKWKLTNISS